MASTISGARAAAREPKGHDPAVAVEHQPAPARGRLVLQRNVIWLSFVQAKQKKASSW